MKLFVGLDVSLETTAICVVSEHGKIVKEAHAASEPEALIRWIRELDGTIAAIGLEAGPLSQWLHRGLTEAGFGVVLMETRQVKGAARRPCRSRPIAGMPRGSRACFIWGGSDRFTSSRSRHKRFARF
ncbi:hypothetical protein GCM10008966_34780 [Rhodovulum strictum]